MAARLDNVLKRAEELEQMHKAPAALDVLYETVTSKRARALPLDQLEPLFTKFVALAVELRRGKVAKDGLHQYKKLVFQLGSDASGVPALVAAVEQLLNLGSERVTEAQKQAREAKVEAEDLEQGSAQDMLLALVSSDDTADRADRDFVTPWLKFLWESFRGVLDVLRNNSKLEAAYSSCALRALDFCAQFERKTEFRRLCDLLRTHLQYAATQSRAYQKEYATARQRAIEQADTTDVSHEQILRQMSPANVMQSPIDLSNADTLQRFLDMRFKQLDVAVKLELWQEAFRSVEDVHTLLAASRRPVGVESMAAYYSTLAHVFAVSKNHLFHAATYLRYFAMLQARRAPEQELRRVSALAILGLLCVPRNMEPLTANSRTRRWMALISLVHCPTREGLISTALQRNVLAYAPEQIRKLFHLLETDFNPLTFKKSLEEVAPALQKPEYAIYTSSLLEVSANAVFDDLAATYSETKLSFVTDLVTFPAPLNSDKHGLERLLVRISAGSGSRVRIDHSTGVVRFVDSFSYPLEGTAGARVRTELFELAKSLERLPPTAAEASKRPTPAQACEQRRIAFQREKQLFRERLNRREERERAEAEEKAREEREKQMREEAAQRERARAAFEEKRAAEERAAIEERRRQEELFAKQARENTHAEKVKIAKGILAKSSSAKIDMDKIDDYSIEELMQMQIKQLDMETRTLSEHMNSVCRRHDHLERALRREEAKLWEKDADEQQVRDRERHVRRTEAFRQGARRAHELGIAYTQRLSRARAEFTTFRDTQRARFDARVAELRERNSKLLSEEKRQRKEAAIAKYLLQKKQEEEKKKLEEERKKQEEERKKQEEERRRLNATPGVPVSAAAGTAPRASPFGAGAGRPAPVTAPRASPFGAGAGRPAPVTAPKASPFGAGAGRPAPVTAPKASPFGAGAGKPAPVTAPKASPFGAGAGRPAPVTTPKASPFGAAAGKPAAAAVPKSSPFGAAAGKPAPAPTPAPTAGPKKGAYVPPSRRG